MSYNISTRVHSAEHSSITILCTGVLVKLLGRVTLMWSSPSGLIQSTNRTACQLRLPRESSQINQSDVCGGLRTLKHNMRLFASRREPQTDMMNLSTLALVYREGRTRSLLFSLLRHFPSFSFASIHSSCQHAVHHPIRRSLRERHFLPIISPPAAGQHSHLLPHKHHPTLLRRLRSLSPHRDQHHGVRSLSRLDRTKHQRRNDGVDDPLGNAMCDIHCLGRCQDARFRGQYAHGCYLGALRVFGCWSLSSLDGDGDGWKFGGMSRLSSA